MLRATAAVATAVLALLVAAPAASACHPVPLPCGGNCSVEELCAWENPPFGVLPFASECAENAEALALGVAGYGLLVAGWGAETAQEIVFGC